LHVELRKEGEERVHGLEVGWVKGWGLRLRLLFRLKLRLWCCDKRATTLTCLNSNDDFSELR
jgi:hypothetical protein